MSSLPNVVNNTGEDFIDELATNVVYQEFDKFFKPVYDELSKKENPTPLDEALLGALQTFKFGLMNLVIVTVTEYAISKSILIFGSLFAYIKSRSLVNRLKNSVNSLKGKFGSKGFKIGKSFDMVSSALIGSENQVLTVSKMANDTSNNIISTISQERLNQITLQGQTIQRIDNNKNNLFNVRNESKTKQMDLFIHKFKTGTWKDTKKDKKLYYDCTGQDNKEEIYNNQLIEKLNSFSEFATTVEGKIYNNSKAILDLLTTTGLKL